MEIKNIYINIVTNMFIAALFLIVERKEKEII